MTAGRPKVGYNRGWWGGGHSLVAHAIQLDSCRPPDMPGITRRVGYKGGHSLVAHAIQRVACNAGTTAGLPWPRWGSPAWRQLRSGMQGGHSLSTRGSQGGGGGHSLSTSTLPRQVGGARSEGQRGHSPSTSSSSSSSSSEVSIMRACISSISVCCCRRCTALYFPCDRGQGGRGRAKTVSQRLTAQPSRGAS